MPGNKMLFDDGWKFHRGDVKGAENPVSGEATMFYGGSDSRFLNHPHAEFYYLTFLPKFYGDHAVSAESSNGDILCYASTFSSGETGAVIVNKGTEDQVVGVDMQSIWVGQNYYMYSFVIISKRQATEAKIYGQT